MTAASGVLHEEMHGREFTARGGTLEMVQLWVNLPARSKMAPPRYQTILDRDIPVVALPGGGRVRVVAGELGGRKGPALTFTPIQLWDARLGAGQRAELRGGAATDGPPPCSRARSQNLPSGSARRSSPCSSREGEEFTVEARSEARPLPANCCRADRRLRPVVMNTEQEIRQAMADFSSGKLGTPAPLSRRELRHRESADVRSANVRSANVRLRQREVCQREVCRREVC
jgi:hypothetical protein